MVRDHPEQHANVVEAYALEGGVKTSHEDRNAAQGGIWVDRTFSLNNNVV